MLIGGVCLIDCGEDFLIKIYLLTLIVLSLVELLF